MCYFYIQRIQNKGIRLRDEQFFYRTPVFRGGGGRHLHIGKNRLITPTNQSSQNLPKVPPDLKKRKKPLTQSHLHEVTHCLEAAKCHTITKSALNLAEKNLNFGVRRNNIQIPTPTYQFEILSKFMDSSVFIF